MSRKKILFVGSYPNLLNEYACVFFRNLIYEIADRGVECYVIAPVSVTNYGIHINKIKKELVEFTSRGSKVYVYHPRYISASAKRIGPVNTSHITTHNFKTVAYSQAKKLGIKFDAVYGHFFLNGGMAASYIAKKMNIPGFMAYGECDFESQVRVPHGEVQKSEIDGICGVISVSGKNSKELSDNGLFENIPVFTCPNAIDHNLFNKCSKEEARKAIGIDAGKFVVGFVGGFIERKGDKRLLEACKDIDDVYLAFAGKGDNPPAGDNVLFCNAVDHEQIGIFLKALDVFVLPTLNEGCCNAILEAMASELPIVSSDLPFNDDVLTDNNSIRIDPMNIGQIRDAVIKLKNDDALRQKLSSAAYEDSQMFTIEKRGERVLEFIYKCAKW